MLLAGPADRTIMLCRSLQAAAALISLWHQCDAACWPSQQCTMLCRYLQAAAALILYPDCSAQQQLMALVCRVPAQFLTPAMMRLATAAWHWICAAQPRLQVSQVLR